MENNSNSNNLYFDFMDDAVRNVQERVDQAINSQDFKDMSRSVTKMVNDTVRQYQQYQKTHPAAQQRTSARRNGGPVSVKTAGAARKTSPVGMTVPQETEAHPELYANIGGERVKAVLLIVGGALLAGVMLLSLLSLQVIHLVTGRGGSAGLFLTLAAAAAGVALVWLGVSGLGRLSRFKKYICAIGNRTYCDFDQLAGAVSKPVSFVRKDIKAMLKKGWFLEGRTDKQETCLITSKETFLQYQETQKALEQQKARAEQDARERAGASPEVREVLDKGKEFLEKIRASNEAIPGEEISEKIHKIEKVTEQIFVRAKEHPEIIPDLKKLMDYYLPTTVKLLNAYEDMDKQPVQGETIQASKKEIEGTLDTLNDAFERLLDSVFQDTAWDVSSDISVLHTMLAQEGLTDNPLKSK